MEIICPYCHHLMDRETYQAPPLGPFDPPIYHVVYRCPHCGKMLSPAETTLPEPLKDNVVEMSDHLPHEVRETMCWQCGHRWVAVYPEKTLLKELECPGCHAQGYAFATGQTLPNDILPEEHRDA